jgi:hypothetical protein
VDSTEELTFLPEGSRNCASPGVPLDNAKARLMTAISGRNLRELFDSSDPVGAFLRTCRESSVWRVALTGYSLTWKRQATPAGRSLFQLRLSRRRIDGTASGLLPPLWTTPNAERATGYMSGAKADTWHPSLDWQARLAPEGPPPDISAGNSSFAERGKRPTVAQLERMVEERMWATPRVEGFDAGKHRGQTDSLHSQMKVAEPGLKLSARWVAALMGYPDGWLDLDPIGKPASPASRSTKPTA